VKLSGDRAESVAENMGKLKQLVLAQTIAQYDIPFENVFDDKILRECFRKHLKTIHNEEPLLFMMELEHYVTLIGIKSRYQAAKKIVAEYLEMNSLHSINISNKLREEAREKVKQSSETSCPKDIFDEIRLAVYLDLKLCMPAFLASDVFRDFVGTQIVQNPDILNKWGSLKEECNASEVSTDNTTQEPEPISKLSVRELYDPKVIEITDADFERVLNDIANTGMWTSVYESETRTVRVSKETCSKGLKKLFETSIVPYSLNECLWAYTDEHYHTRMEKETKYMRVVSFHKFEKYAGVIIQKDFNVPFMKKRDFVLLCSSRREPNGSITFARKSVEIDQVPETSSAIRAFICGGMRFEKISENQTRYDMIFFGDLGGWVSASVFNLIMSKRDDKWLKALCKSCEERRHLGLAEPFKSYQVLDTLKYFDKMNNRKK
jgi:hypothetical protein